MPILWVVRPGPDAQMVWERQQERVKIGNQAGTPATGLEQWIGL